MGFLNTGHAWQRPCLLHQRSQLCAAVGPHFLDYWSCHWTFIQTVSREICGSFFSNPSKEMSPLDFIAGALDIWQAEVRAEPGPLLRGLHAPAVLVMTLQVGLRQPQQITWKVITMMARAL